ncbi:ribonuclease H-like domain-containing protein, partial [Tanacetum coccineum]
EFDPSEDPSSDHIPPLPAISPFLSSADDTTDNDTPDTPPSPTHGTPFTETTLSTQRSPTVSGALRRRVMILAPGQPIPHGRSYRYHLNGSLIILLRIIFLRMVHHRIHHRVHRQRLLRILLWDALSDSASSRSSSDHSFPASPSGMRSSHRLCSLVMSVHHSSTIFERPSHDSSSASHSRKRSRSPIASVPLSSPTLGALSYACADLLPSPKRIRSPETATDLEDCSEDRFKPYVLREVTLGVDFEDESSEPSRSRGADLVMDVQDYALWEVIENGNSWVSVPQTAQENGTSVTKMSVPVTAEEKTNKKNDVKARSLLLMALPNEHQLTFSSRRFLPPEWNTHVVVWMNKAEIKIMSIDDLYNNFKIVEESVNKYVGASSGDQNLAFMTAPSNSSTNDVNTAKPAYEVSTNPNGSNLLQQDLEQIHEDDLEAMDLKWQLSLLSMRTNRYFQRTGKKIFINANNTTGYDKSKVECFNCHKMGHFTKECRAQRNKEGQFRYQDNTRKQGNNENTSSKAMLAIDGVSFDWSDMAK